MATIIVCDICGKNQGVERVWYFYDRRNDGAGSIEDCGETYDLCIECKLKITEAVLADIVDSYKGLHKNLNYRVTGPVFIKRIKCKIQK